MVFLLGFSRMGGAGFGFCGSFVGSFLFDFCLVLLLFYDLEVF